MIQKSPQRKGKDEIYKEAECPGLITSENLLKHTQGLLSITKTEA